VTRLTPLLKKSRAPPCFSGDRVSLRFLTRMELRDGQDQREAVRWKFTPRPPSGVRPTPGIRALMSLGASTAMRAARPRLARATSPCLGQVDNLALL